MRTNIIIAGLLLVVLVGGTMVMYSQQQQETAAPAAVANLPEADQRGLNGSAVVPGDGSEQDSAAASSSGYEVTYYVIHDTGTDFVLAPRETVVTDARRTTWRRARTALTAMETFEDDSNGGFVGPVPQDARIQSVQIENGIATVDLSPQFVENFPGGARFEQMTIYAIVNTVGTLEGVKGVRFTVDKEPLYDLGGHIDLSEPLAPDLSLVETSS